jgi:hypothetical protein
MKTKPDEYIHRCENCVKEDDEIVFPFLKTQDSNTLPVRRSCQAGRITFNHTLKEMT